MRAYRFILFGIILLIYSCGGGGAPQLLTARSTDRLTVSVDKPFVIGIANLPDGDATDDIVVTVSGGTGSYSLSAGADTDLFTPIPSPSWIPAPSITLDPDIVTTLTSVKFTATDTVNGRMGETDLIIIPFTAVTGALSVTLVDDAILNCGGDTVTVVVQGGVPPYTITESTAFVSITGSPVGASGGSFDVVGDACTSAGTNNTDVTVTDTVPDSITFTFTTLDP